MTAPVLLVLLCAMTAFGGEVQGDVVDSEGAVVGGATIRLLTEDTRLTSRRCQTDDYGHFDLGAIPAGPYIIATSATGFQEKLVRIGSLSSGVQRVRIRLEVIGCDAPGVNCDDFSAAPYSDPHPVRTKGHLRLRPVDAVDLNRGDLKQSSSGADVELQTRGSKGLYLAPINRARIAQLGAADANCTHAKYGRGPVRIDGLGPGADLCVLTNGGGRSQIFITRDVVATSGEVELSYVTRKR